MCHIRESLWLLLFSSFSLLLLLSFVFSFFLQFTRFSCPDAGHLTVTRAVNTCVCVNRSKVQGLTTSHLALSSCSIEASISGTFSLFFKRTKEKRIFTLLTWSLLLLFGSIFVSFFGKVKKKLLFFHFSLFT